MTSITARPIVAVTRDERIDDGFSRALESRGAHALPLATIEIAPPDDIGPLTAALAALASTDWVVFTSGHAVEAACSRPEWLQARRDGTLRARVAAVGRVTAERLATHGVTVDVVPAAGGSARELVDALVRIGSLQGRRILWPRSEAARRELPDALARQGAIVVDPPAYRTVPVVPPALPEFLDGLAAGRIGAVTFMSPSSAHGLARALPTRTLSPLTGRTLIASLGRTTSEAIVALGAGVDIEAGERSAAALAAAVIERLSSRRGDAA